MEKKQMGQFVDNLIWEQEVKALKKYLSTRNLTFIESMALLNHLIHEFNAQVIELKIKKILEKKE